VKDKEMIVFFYGLLLFIYINKKVDPRPLFVPLDYLPPHLHEELADS
jgi:hypothetical protein